ncbi:phosphatidylserine decarboxylase family protein [Candidatus Woesearchaeota archaeon]|nr:phosphatidylserine decarboxylase family protein [Candidatus Woesearchaeota archaeon]
MLGIVLYIALIFILLLALFLLNFYRDPERKIPKGNNIVSPADGRIIRIIKINSNEKIKIKKGILGKIETLTKDVAKECYLVSIFMSPFDVHINRAPIDGKIKKIKYEKGRFFSAFNFEKSLKNEKNEILIESKIGNVKAIQIAGFLARKIKCFVKENQKINKGQKIGAIVLGSQVSLVIPAKITLKIKIGDKVKAGSTIIAGLK